MSGEFRLSDRQWRRVEPLLPNKPRGVPRVDDRRVISGIVHVLRSGGRWVDAPTVYGPRQDPLQPLRPVGCQVGCQGGLDGDRPSAGRRGRPAREASARQHACEGAPLRLGRQRGQRLQALGISRGGRTTKIHALSDGFGRPLAFLLTPGQAADCRAAKIPLRRLPSGVLVMADRAYDTDAVRERIQTQGAVPNIPPKRTRRWKHCFSPVLYRGRNAIERIVGRLKDFRRIAPRYGKLATNFLAAIHLAAAVSYWL